MGMINLDFFNLGSEIISKVFDGSLKNCNHGFHIFGYKTILEKKWKLNKLVTSCTRKNGQEIVFYKSFLFKRSSKQLN